LVALRVDPIRDRRNGVGADREPTRDLEAVAIIRKHAGLTGGGPIRQTNTLAYLLYNTGFVELDQGRGNAIAIVMFMVNMALIAVYIRILGKQPGAAA
jgi:ABC-type sugar transport system permease subunit